MKVNIISSILFITLLFLSYCHNLKSGEHNNSTEYKTFLVKTKLSKEELQTLLKQGESEITNLKKNKTHNNTVVILEVNSTNLTDGALQKKIEQEIKEDSLHPIHEFHLNQSEVTTLVTKPKTRFIDSLYEKKFGKIYGYLTLFFFAFVMIYYKDIIFNQKKLNTKTPYFNKFEFFNEKEYMLVKNN